MKKKSFNHNIQIFNESEDNELFEKYKEVILETVTILAESNFDFDIELDIIVKKALTNKNEVIDEVDAAYMTINKKGKYILCVTLDSLERYEKDNGFDLDNCIYHEMVHIFDAYKILNNKYYKFNPLLVKQKNMYDFVLKHGYSFWTEFFAYYHTYKTFYKYQESYPTFLKLVKWYEKLEQDNQYIQYLLKTKSKKEMYNAAYDFENDITQFVYAIAKHLAGLIKGRPNNTKYCAKTRAKKSFRYMEKVCSGLLTRIVPMFTNTYGKGMLTKLKNIGVFIINKLYINFNVYPLKHRGRIRLGFYKDCY